MAISGGGASLENKSIFCSVFNNDVINFLYVVGFFLLLIILLIGTIYIVKKRKKLINYYKNLKLFYLNLILFSFILFIFALAEIYIGLPNLLFFYGFFIFFYTAISFLINRKNKKENNFYIIGFLLFIIIFPYLLFEHDRCNYAFGGIIAHKPVIYLYPQEKQEIKVELEVEGKIIADYPRYDEEIRGWKVLAYPDSTIIDDGKEYSYLFWEAEFENNNWDLSKGFIVEGKDAREFLQEKLSYIGLTPREYNEFIVYWYPLMMNNKYNLVYFAGLDYTQKAPLKITPEPDSILRVFTVIKPLEEKIDLPEQELKVFDRKGFTIVEWGGTILE